jgi:hypothetical protein
MNSDKANSFNGVNTQTLSSLQKQPEMANATFSARSKWGASSIAASDISFGNA